MKPTTLIKAHRTRIMHGKKRRKIAQKIARRIAEEDGGVACNNVGSGEVAGMDLGHSIKKKPKIKATSMLRRGRPSPVDKL